MRTTGRDASRSERQVDFLPVTSTANASTASTTFYGSATSDGRQRAHDLVEHAIEVLRGQKIRTASRLIDDSR